MNNRFLLVLQSEQVVIKDVEHNENFLFLASSGFGTPSTNIKLAEKVVDFLNSLPAEETLLYPFNVI